MKKAKIVILIKKFENYSNIENGVEFWYARDLQNLLGYNKWENFLKVLEKGMESCEKSNNIVNYHFPDVRKMIDLGKGARREIDDYMLTRYACYLIAQNGDSRKDEIAFAQSYFAIQTRKQELIEERLKLNKRLRVRKKLTESETELSKLIYERGVDYMGFARIRSKGDRALFGGFNTEDMKKKLDIPKKRAIADFLPTITITAKNLATEITNFNVKQNNLNGEKDVSGEHVKNNKDIRRLLNKSGIKPEELPKEEDLAKLQRKVNREEKELAHLN